VTVLNHLSLFSGYEGFGLGLKLAEIPFRTIGYVEIDEYCQRLLQARIRDGYLDWAPIIRDIRSADFRPMAGLVDIVTAGFCCQPFSRAGKHAGEKDVRNLWPETIRVIRDVGPQYVLLENVANLVFQPYWGTILGELAEARYDTDWDIVSACEVGAPHTRERVLILAHSNRERCANITRGAAPTTERNIGDAIGLGCGSNLAVARAIWEEAESSVGRVIDGTPGAVAQLRACGNGIVPGVVGKFLRGTG
jgi:DNA (cytosine-5)-methyltransferase 1